MRGDGQFTYIIFQHSPSSRASLGSQTWNRSEQQLFNLIALARFLLNLDTSGSQHTVSQRGLDCNVCSTICRIVVTTHRLMNTKEEKITSSNTNEHQDLLAPSSPHDCGGSYSIMVLIHLYTCLLDELQCQSVRSLVQPLYMNWLVLI